MHQLAVGHRLAHDLLGAKRLLVPVEGLGRSIDDEVRCDGVVAVGNRFRHVLAPLRMRKVIAPRRSDKPLVVPCRSPRAATRELSEGRFPDSSPANRRAGKTGGRAYPICVRMSSRISGVLLA